MKLRIKVLSFVGGTGLVFSLGACHTPRTQSASPARLQPSVAVTMEETPSPRPQIDFRPSASAITETCKSALKIADHNVDHLASPGIRHTDFKSTVAALENVLVDLDLQIAPFLFLKEVSTSTEVQGAASACEDDIKEFLVKTFARGDLYQIIDSVARSQPKLDLQDSKLMLETLRSFRRTGAALNDDKRAEVAQIQQEIGQLENRFSKNIAQANDTIDLSLADLEGVPADVIETMPPGPHNTRKLTLLNPALFIAFIDNARHEGARQKVYIAHESVVANENVPLLEKTIALRHRFSNILGFPSYAAYSLDIKMAKSPEQVEQFLDDLEKRLSLKNKNDLALLLKIKKTDDPTATTLNPWDVRYYSNQYKKQNFKLDPQLLKEYFPAPHVLDSVLALYQKLLKIKFRELKPALAWADDVRLFEIIDAQSNSVLGHFYLDLFPRENKYKHFAAFDIVKGRLKEDGSYQTPVAALVGNFPQASGKQPALLTHNDVETLFHEFGHIMHQTLTRARYSSLSGSNVRTDFVEAPSQMLENWVWEPSILKKISQHFRTKKPLPTVVIHQMIRSKHALEGIYWMRQLFFAKVDMEYHSQKAIDTTEIWHRFYNRMTGLKAVPGTRPQASLGHLMGGYQAGYYSYLWSKVFAEDMFTVFKTLGLENPKAGLRYRHWILSPGGTQEPDLLLKGFLKREPNRLAFEQSLGIAPSNRPGVNRASTH